MKPAGRIGYVTRARCGALAGPRRRSFFFLYRSFRRLCVQAGVEGRLGFHRVGCSLHLAERRAQTKYTINSQLVVVVATTTPETTPNGDCVGLLENSGGNGVRKAIKRHVSDCKTLGGDGEHKYYVQRAVINFHPPTPAAFARFDGLLMVIILQDRLSVCVTNYSATEIWFTCFCGRARENVLLLHAFFLRWKYHFKFFVQTKLWLSFW